MTVKAAAKAMARVLEGVLQREAAEWDDFELFGAGSELDGLVLAGQLRQRALVVNGALARLGVAPELVAAEFERWAALEAERAPATPWSSVPVGHCWAAELSLARCG